MPHGDGGCWNAVQGCSATNNANVQVKAAKAAALSIISPSLSPSANCSKLHFWSLSFFESRHLFRLDPVGGGSNGKGTFVTLTFVTIYRWDQSAFKGFTLTFYSCIFVIYI